LLFHSRRRILMYFCQFSFLSLMAMGYGNQKRNMGPYAIIFQNKTKYCNENGVNSYCDKLFLVQYLVTANSTVKTFIFSNRKRNKNVRFCDSLLFILKIIEIYLHMAPENHFGCHTPKRDCWSWSA
ncbi:hypothetical protein, partial [Bacillus cereus]|uniref:hypothetical protein n=1 Tax=Bacillus cereus TaxID=1396 RepID=UPI0021136FB6|nr:hypothetical protein [Bacillus cereus]